MSGIAGKYNLDGRPQDPDCLHRMTAAIEHRGPDGGGVWAGGPCGLGHRMLRTTPESLHEEQPLLDDGGAIVVVADARIDNRDELVPILHGSGGPGDAMTDSQVILGAYKKWGPRCPEKLLGDFAFAIWDSNRRQLFCARDPMGVKPLFYHHGPGVFVFASEIKAILAVPGIPKRLNEARLADLLWPSLDDQSGTLYHDIYPLPPGHILTVGGTGPRIEPYWQLDPSRELRLASSREYEEGFRELFSSAVKCRLRSAVPVGSTLSGGLDSSSIACVADQLRADLGLSQLHTFSAIFPGAASESRNSDERPFIESVLAKGAFTHHYLDADRGMPFGDTAWPKDEMLAMPNWYIVCLLFSAAKQSGVRVLLSGVDGDLTVSYGLELLDQLARDGKWPDFAREAHGIADHFGGDPVSYFRRHGAPYLSGLAVGLRWRSYAKQLGAVFDHFEVSRLKLIRDTGLKPLVLRPLLRGDRPFFRHARFRTQPRGLNRAINPAFAQRVGLVERMRTSGNPSAPMSDRTLRKQHADGLQSGYVQHLMGWFDQTAAIFGLEQRYPFFDRRLIEFCLALPFEQKLRDGWTRSILRRAMGDVLPPAVQWRSDKGDQSITIRQRLLEERASLDAVILKDPDIIDQYIDVAALRAAYDRYLADPLRASEEDLFTIFLSVNLALWLRQSVESESAPL